MSEFYFELLDTFLLFTAGSKLLTYKALVLTPMIIFVFTLTKRKVLCV